MDKSWTDLAAANDIAPLINNDTLILSLLGTRGAKSEWDDRRTSQGHMGIPLASAAFVDKIPMISRLLKQVGLDLDWIDSRDADIVTKTLGARRIRLKYGIDDPIHLAGG